VNSESIPALVDAEPECREFELAPGDCLSLEFLGGTPPVALFLDQSDSLNRLISVWPADGGFRSISLVFQKRG
jgi:hypothetical protein